jgi:hypothetical protein
MALKEEDRQYFEVMESLFTHPGWKLLADDVRGWQEAIATQWRSLKPDQLQFEQGRAAAFDQVLKHFELCESLKATALEADDNTEETDV